MTTYPPFFQVSLPTPLTGAVIAQVLSARRDNVGKYLGSVCRLAAACGLFDCCGRANSRGVCPRKLYENLESVTDSAHSRDSDANVFVPVGLSVGTDLVVDTDNYTAFTLDGEKSLATLDYGRERAGYPFFVVAKVDEPVQIEVKYSEAFIALDHPWSDGPYSFATGLSNSFRVETFNVTTAGRFSAPLIQGGQRWQSIRLLSEGTINFSEVGFEATVDTTEVSQFPGQFECDDEQLNEIWKLGAVAASTACVEKGTQKASWEIDPENGAYIRSQRASQAISGAFLSNYTLAFETMIERGGVWWSVVCISVDTRICLNEC